VIDSLHYVPYSEVHAVSCHKLLADLPGRLEELPSISPLRLLNQVSEDLRRLQSQVMCAYEVYTGIEEYFQLVCA